MSTGSTLPIPPLTPPAVRHGTTRRDRAAGSSRGGSGAAWMRLAPMKPRPDARLGRGRYRMFLKRAALGKTAHCEGMKHRDRPLDNAGQRFDSGCVFAGV